MDGECQACVKAETCDWVADLKQFVDIDVELISDVNDLSKKQREYLKTQREERREEIIKQASALRNTGGGILFIHIRGLDIRNRNLHYFNELVDSRLDNLIQDGSLFVNNYAKIWAVEKIDRDFPEAHEFLLLSVKGSPVLSTYDYKLKVATDESVRTPTLQNVYHLIHSTAAEFVEGPRIRGSSDFVFEEKRNIQLKAFRNNDFVDNITSENILQLVDFIWEKLRLREYITSFATINGGGSYFVGVEESYSENLRYRGKENKAVGISIDPRLIPHLERALSEKIQNNTLVEPVLCGDLVRLQFHPVKRNFVLEVAVRQVQGCVFYDKKGPEAFSIFKHKLRPISFQKWRTKLDQLTINTG